MTQFLPANLLALFAPREPLPYLPPPQPKHVKESCSLSGIGQYAGLFEDPDETPIPKKVPTRAERREAKRIEKEVIHKRTLEETIGTWDPHNDANATGDAFKTVFVSRINYDTREDKLRREFEEFGYIRRIHMVCDVKTGKPRGYAFIEYETEKGMRSAFKYGDGRKIDGRRVVVDIERGRTVKNWKPRKFGGGLGGTRIGAPDMNITHSGRVDPRQYQEKLARAQAMRERMLNPDKEDPNRERSKSLDKSRERSRDRSERRGGSQERSRDDDRRDDRRRESRRDDGRDRTRDKRDDRKRDRSERDDDRSRRDRTDDRKRDRRDDDRDRDRKRERRDRDGDRVRDRERDGEKDREGDRDRDRDYRDRDGDKDQDRERDGDREKDRDRDGDRRRERDREEDREPKKEFMDGDMKIKDEIKTEHAEEQLSTQE